MEIREVTDINEIMQIIPLEIDTMKDEPQGMPLRDRLTWIEGELNGKQIYTKYEFKVFMIYENKLIGYAVAALSKAKIKYFSEIRIFRVWHDNSNPEIGKKFMDFIHNWAKENKINKIRIEVNKPNLERLFRMKYGFKTISTNMEKEV